MKRQRPDGSEDDNDNDSDNVTVGASSTQPTDHIPQLQQTQPQILPPLQPLIQMQAQPEQQTTTTQTIQPTQLPQDIPVPTTPIPLVDPSSTTTPSLSLPVPSVQTEVDTGMRGQQQQQQQPLPLQQYTRPHQPQPLPVSFTLPSMSATCPASTDFAQQETQLIERAGRLLDFRAKPPQFSGESDAWPEYRFRMEMLLGMLGLKECMANALRDPVSFTQAKINASAELRAQSMSLYSLLSETCHGRAHVLIRIESEGLLAWRRLNGEYQPSKAFRYVNLLAQLLNPTFLVNQQFMPQLLTWEREVHEYEAQTGNRLDDGVKCGVIARHAPEQIRNFLTLTYEDLSEKFRQTQRSATAIPSQDPDV